LGAITRSILKPKEEIYIQVKADYVDYEVIITCQELPQCIINVYVPKVMPVIAPPFDAGLELEAETTTVNVGQTITIVARLCVSVPVEWDSGLPIGEAIRRSSLPNQTIEIYIKTGEQDWNLYRTGNTTYSGGKGIFPFTFTSNITGTYQIKAVYRGSKELKPCESPTLEINVVNERLPVDKTIIEELSQMQKGEVKEFKVKILEETPGSLKIQIVGTGENITLSKKETDPIPEALVQWVCSLVKVEGLQITIEPFTEDIFNITVEA